MAKDILYIILAQLQPIDIWKKSIKNIIHKGCLKMIHNDYDSGFETL